MSDGTDGSKLAQEWREAREALLELAAKLPETRAYRNTDRAGWTLKHELSHVAGLDEELRDGATHGRRHLGVDLVGRDLDDRVALGDLVALGDVPLQHDALGHRFAHRGHLDLNGPGRRHRGPP